MYLEPTETYYDGGGQHARRARFLILIQPPGVEGGKLPIRAIVRKVALHQCGHWMMGTARAFGHSILISGAYGADGLTCSVPASVYARGVELPADLVSAWNTGGGWNSSGTEAPAMRAWAIANLPALSPGAL